MNTNHARETSMERVLQKIGHLPSKIIGDDYWYNSPFRPEKTPSFKVNIKLNRWYDHGEQIGGNTIDFLIHKFGFTVSETLEYLKPFTSDIDPFSIQKQKSEITKTNKTEINYISKIIPIQHIALVQYLESRHIKNYKDVRQLKEIHYTINDKDYFGIGFQNNSEGWEIRSKYAKICLRKKDITLITNESKTLRIYEGFFDYLSFVQVRENLRMQESDYLILNSVALLLKNVSVLMKYTSIELYLDNDSSGNNYTELIRKQFEQAVDCRKLYREYEDLNDWLKAIVLKERITC
jgi:hypothetical protein